MPKTTNRILCTLLLMVVAIVMYFLNLFTPLFCDDWHYCFIYGTQTPIRTIGDIFVSQWHHYFEFNCRFIAHVFVQLFDGLLGKNTFNVVNAVLFALFLYALAVVTSRDRKQYYKIISVAFILTFLFITGFKYVFLWMSGSCNYLWLAILLLFFYRLMERDDISPRYNVPLLVYGFICGWSNEAMVLGLAGAYFLYYAFHRKELNTRRSLMLAGLFIGTLFLIFSPASINRALVSSAKQVSLLDRIIYLQNLRLFFILILIVAVKTVFGRLHFKTWVKNEQLLIMATLISIAFIIFTGYYYSHSRFGIELFSLLLILRVIDWPKVNSTAICLANLGTVAFAIYVITICARCGDVARQEIARVEAGDTQIATISLVSPSSYLNRFVLDYQGLGTNDGIDEVKYYGEDDWIPKYYGFKDKFVYFWPQAFLDDIQVNRDAYNEFHTFEGLPFYAKRADSPNPELSSVQVTYQPSKWDSLPWPLNRLCAKIAGHSDCDILMAKTLPVNGEDYIIVQKMHPSQEVKEIQIIKE